MDIRRVERQEVFMNTSISIQVYSDQSTILTQEKIQEAFGCFARVVQKFTRFDATSELSRLNNNSGKPFPVSSELFNLIVYMIELSRLTDGKYDPTIIDLLETYGYNSTYDFHNLNDPDLYDKVSKLVRSRPSPMEIKLDEEKLTVCLAKNQRLDLGSIGKGYAIDLAYEVLDGFPAVMINAGGDIRLKGPKPDGLPWTLNLSYSQLPNRELHQETSLGSIELSTGSLCGSGGWARKVRFFHHLINPKTGIPINEVSQTFVYAPKALDADAWATVLFTTGRAGLSLLQAKGYEGIVIDEAGKLFPSTGFKI